MEHACDLDVLAARIRALIEQEVGVEVEDVDVDLLETGLLDSLAVVALMTAIEDHFGCEFPLDDFDLDQFRSVRAMATFVAPLTRS